MAEPTRSRRSALAAAPLVVALSGCISYTPHSIVAETSPIANLDRVEAIGPAHGRGCAAYLLGLPLRQSERMSVALEDAKRTSGADALVMVSADTVYRSFVLYADECVHVRGTAVRIRKEDRS